jgi:beta-glucosidase
MKQNKRCGQKVEQDIERHESILSSNGDFSMKNGLLMVMALALLALADSAWLDKAKPADERAGLLMKEMTLEEKCSLCVGTRSFFIRGIPRLGIPEMTASDGPTGVGYMRPASVYPNRSPSTSYPSNIGWAASFNPEIAKANGESFGREDRARGVGVHLAPGMNIYRMPVAGRNFEYLGEDPFLAGTMASAFIRGIQSQGVMATAKHFCCNNQEFDRNWTSSDVDERTLREIYLPAFEKAVKEGGVWAVMCSYNPINGTQASENQPLLVDILKKDWGFQGFVMSDWGAVRRPLEPALNGLDLEMNFGYHWDNGRLFKMVQEGKVPETVIDDKVRRILRAYLAIGFLDRPQLDPSLPVYSAEASRAALRTAREGMVLLKNEGILPIDRSKVKTVAVIGPNAMYGYEMQGGGSAEITAARRIDTMTAMVMLAGDQTLVSYHPGTGQEIDDGFFRDSSFRTPEGKPGLKAEYFNNLKLEGEPVLVRTDKAVCFNWKAGSPDPRIVNDGFTVRWTGTVTPAEAGEFQFVLRSDDGGRIYLDDELLADTWGDHPVQTVAVDKTLEKGRAYRIRIEYMEARGDAEVAAGWGRHHDAHAEAAAVAAKADVAIVCVGFNANSEYEGGDRSFRLPDAQDKLIQAVAAANPNTVVVLNAGGNVEMAPWLGQVKGLLMAWYPGQEGGRAVAEILFGDVNPSGKLPATFEKQLEDNPCFASYWDKDGDKRVAYKEGVFVGYRGYDAGKIEPQFPFGFGLSYTTFAYGAAAISAREMTGGQTLTVTIPVTNTGRRAGAEIVQLYIHDAEASVPRPPQELKGFQKLLLQPGETKTASFTITRRDLSFWDVATHGWKAEPGQFEIRLGASSRDIRAKAVFELK